jgi:hypothetical protein
MKTGASDDGTAAADRSRFSTNSSPRQKLDASSAFTKARARVEELKSATLAGDATVKAAEGALRKAKFALEQLRRQELAATEARLKKAEVAGGLTKNNDSVVSTLTAQKFIQRKDAAEVQAVRKALLELDAAIADYVDNNPLADRVKDAALKGEPAAGMPQELLKLIGTYEVRAESERRKVVTFRPFGHSFVSWELQIDDGKVAAQAKREGAYGEWTVILPERSAKP